MGHVTQATPTYGSFYGPHAGGVIQNHIFGFNDLNLPIRYITFMGL